MAQGRQSARSLPSLVAMVHLPPLPGSPRFRGSMEAVVEEAVDRASRLTAAGFGALMVENFGDTPFFAGRVPPVTVAAVTACVSAIRAAVPVPVGVNVLRNDAAAALGVAAVTGAAFIRVNVLTGTMNTDQGPVVGQAAELLRQRAALAIDVAIWADVFVKHATPPPGATLAEAASDTFERGGADALVISGARTGEPTDLETLELVRTAVPDAPLVVGSGATPETLPELAKLADHIIVGSALERDGRPGDELDERRLDRFMEAAEAAGLT